MMNPLNGMNHFLVDGNSMKKGRPPPTIGKCNIFLLNESQWKNFSVSVIRDFQNKLANVKTVGFEQVMEISEAVDGIVT